MNKVIKNIKLIALIVLTIFIGIKGVNADTKTITYSVSDSSGAFVDKRFGDEFAYCLSGSHKTAPEEGMIYSSHAESPDNIKYAYIIKAQRSNGVAFIEGELSTNGANTTLPSEYNDDLALYNSQGTITTNVNILDFQKSGTNYVASVTLSGYKFSDYGTCTISGATGTISKGTITNGSGTITITIPQSNIIDDTTVTLTCSGAVQKYSTTKTYVCSETNNELSCSNYQDLVVEREGQKTSNVSISGPINPEKKGSIEITKKGKNYNNVETPLPGVKFVIKNGKGKYINSNGETPSSCNATGLDIKNMPEECVFTTESDGKFTISDLTISSTASDNVYTITEIASVPGYVRSTNDITVTLTTTNNSIKKTIKNETVRVTISKTDATGKGELPGALLKLVDKDGNILTCLKDNDKKLINYYTALTGVLTEEEIAALSPDDKLCKWVSGNESFIIEGLLPGKYYLVEEMAPDGYVKSSERILIEINEDGAVEEKYVMKNALEVPVPDTLSARSALLLVVAMFDVALGIGIVTYVKKHKAEE